MARILENKTARNVKLNINQSAYEARHLAKPQNVVFKLMKDNTQRITKDKVRQSEENLKKLQRQEITYKEYFKNTLIKWDSAKEEEKILFKKYSYELLFDRLFEEYLQTDDDKEFIKYYSHCLEFENNKNLADYFKFYVYNLTCQSPLKYKLSYQ
jgi:hypothetical protein